MTSSDQGTSSARADSGVKPTKRRKNAPAKLPSPVDSNEAESSSSSEDSGITVKIRPGRAGIKIDAPGTPYDEISLTEGFIQALKKGKPPPIPLKKRRRLFFIGGSLLGVILSLSVFLGTSKYHAKLLSELESKMSSFEFGFPNSGLTGFGGWDGIANMLNMSDLIAPNARKWLENRDFKVGREAKAAGLTKKHAVILIPGVISTGLESWGTDQDTAQFFRKRVWGGGSMVQAIVTRKKEWMKAMALDTKTGLDPEGGGIKVRAAQGLDAASYFVTGYWIWSKIIENLAVIDYDYNDLSLQAYDWRLSYVNLQHRDAYFSRLKAVIEHNKSVLGKQTVLVSHSMGGTVTLWFLKWVEGRGYGDGGPDWVEKHIAAWVNIGGCMLGVPKAMAAFMSGEMRDTVELNPAGVYLLEKLFSKQERAKLFRTWAGSASMLLKGGDAIWGKSTFFAESGAPDDADNATMSTRHMFLFKDVGSQEANATAASPNLTLDNALVYLKHHTSTDWHDMVSRNFSLGFERSRKQLERNSQDHTKWSNPLEIQLPKAPSMKIYCLYGWGKPTERGYFYSRSDNVSVQEATEEKTEKMRGPNRVSWIENGVNLDHINPSVKAGVINGEGDGTVPLLSSGTMCVEGWHRKLYNPAGIKVITHELKHEPLAFDPRGGPTTADHIDALGTTVVNEAVLQVAAGQGHLVNETIYSNIREYAKKVKWDG
ncbi:MAG: hypothetical protein CYPHOPRED_006121 [Cyphobasidiales sp. Tagirdzhanova-0007]|nr:MAG: hypothetical protein CYPHOPRED_006121 [Cyphobasidiales sp. Tagirdzhanova-0007]